MSEFVLSARDLRAHLSDVLDRARGGDPTVVTRNGKQVAAVVPVEMLRQFEHYEEQAIVKLADARLKAGGPYATLDEVLAETLARDE